MTNPQSPLYIADYNYDLPDERIAKYPLAERDQSKLLVYRNGQVSEDRFFHVGDYIAPHSLLISNNTRVIQARLFFYKETGARVEILVLEPAAPAEYQENFAQRGQTAWYCMVGGLKKWKQGPLTAKVQINGEEIEITAERENLPLPTPKEGAQTLYITFKWTGDWTWSEVLEAMGELPIPPYLNRKSEESDKRTYQTVYSKIEGSVAAPTAGLHFTQSVLEEIDKRGIEREEVTLHVGAGTFRPVKSEDIGGHDMHTEHIAVRRQTIEKLIAHGGRAIAVGTTSVRTLESLYWIGRKLVNGEGDPLHVSQWEPYEFSIFNLQSSIGSACVPACLVRQRNECYRLSSVRCRLCVATGTYGLCARSLPRTAARWPRPTRLLPTRLHAYYSKIGCKGTTIFAYMQIFIQKNRF